MKSFPLRMLCVLGMAVLVGSSVQAQVLFGSVKTVTGASDLDLTNVVYAANLTDGSTDLALGGVTFTALNAHSISGVTEPTFPFIALGAGGFGGSIPSLGDANLNAIVGALGYTDRAGTAVNFAADVTIGQTYKLQLLFYEPFAGANRRYDFTVNGSLALDEFAPYAAQGSSSATASVYSYTFTAASSSLTFQGTAGSTGSNNDPLLSGFILSTAVPEPGTIALLGLGLSVLLVVRKRKS